MRSFLTLSFNCQLVFLFSWITILSIAVQTLSFYSLDNFLLYNSDLGPQRNPEHNLWIHGKKNLGNLEQEKDHCRMDLSVFLVVITLAIANVVLYAFLPYQNLTIKQQLVLPLICILSLLLLTRYTKTIYLYSMTHRPASFSEILHKVLIFFLFLY